MTASIDLGPLGRVEPIELVDVDLDEEVILVDGVRLTEARAAEVAREIARRHGRLGGRPRKPDAERASVQKAVRLTPHQAQQLAELASARGVKESEIVRSALDAYLSAV